MIREAIDKILELRKPEIIDVDGRSYSTHTINPVYFPEPNPLKINTLTGVVDYIEKKIDVSEGGGNIYVHRLAIHIKDFAHVDLITPLYGDFFQRSEIIRAIHDMPSFQFGQWMDTETFIINIQAQFFFTGGIESMISVVGNLRHEESIQQEDDGVTQTVTAKAGMAKVTNVQVPNPITLKPYRTFLELDQPASQFIFRMRKDERGFWCSLHEADGGRWNLEAIERIRDWLHNKLPEVPIIA